MINVRKKNSLNVIYWKSKSSKKELDEIAPFLTNSQYKIFQDSKEKYFELWGDTDRTLKRGNLLKLETR